MKSNKQKLEKAIRILRDGGIVIFPTDTAFGIGCRIDSHTAVDRIFRIKHRPRSKAIPVLTSSKAMAYRYLSTPRKIVRLLMDKYWPGGLTIVARCNTDAIYSPIRGSGTTVGFRMPDHDIPLSLIEKAGIPILGSSANLYRESTPYKIEDLDPKVTRFADYVIPGKCKLNIVSTVIDTSKKPPVILRQGAVLVEQKLMR